MSTSAIRNDQSLACKYTITSEVHDVLLNYSASGRALNRSVLLCDTFRYSAKMDERVYVLFSYTLSALDVIPGIGHR